MVAEEKLLYPLAKSYAPQATCEATEEAHLLNSMLLDCWHNLSGASLESQEAKFRVLKRLMEVHCSLIEQKLLPELQAVDLDLYQLTGAFKLY